VLQFSQKAPKNQSPIKESVDEAVVTKE